MAGLTFGGIQSRNDILATPQFEKEDAKTVQYTQVVGGAQELAYTVPKGKTYYITKIILANIKTAASTYRLYLNEFEIEQPFTAKGPIFYEWSIAPYVLGSEQTIKIKSNNDTDTITITGWEV